MSRLFVILQDFIHIFIHFVIFYIHLSDFIITMAATQSPYSNLQQNVHQALDELVADESVYIPNREAEELFNLPDSVQIFFISPDGRVSTFSQPCTLRIFKFKNINEGAKETSTFIQVNGWTHPLGEGSPVLSCGNGSFMFPDAYSEEEGASVVIVDGTPFNTDGEAETQLELILEQLTALKKQQVPETEKDLKLGTLGKIIFKGAETIGKTMEIGAEKGTKLIDYVSEKQKAKIQPAEEDAKISSALKTSVKGARYATQATVKVSGFVATRVGKLTKSLANSLGKIFISY